MARLPASVVTQRHGVGTTTAAVATTTTVTTATTSPATASVTAAAAATTVASHLGKTGIDLLLGLLEDVDQFTSLLGVCEGVSKAILTSRDE